jgi:hypothetical protein
MDFIDYKETVFYFLNNQSLDCFEDKKLRGNFYNKYLFNVSCWWNWTIFHIKQSLEYWKQHDEQAKSF